MIKWPGKTVFTTYLLASLRLTMAFVTIYGFCNWLASQRQNTFRLWMNWELSIPLVPWMILFYMSLNVLLLLPLFTLNQDYIQKLEKGLISTTVTSGIFFLAMPAHIGYNRSLDVGAWKSFYEILFSLDRTANTFPSLHIAYSYLTVRIVASVATKLSFALWIWFLIICLSVLLVHQHHLVDIFGGVILSEVTFRWTSHAQTSSSP